MVDLLKILKEKKKTTVNAEFCMQQSYSTKNKEEIKKFQINNNWEHLLLAELPYKNY